MMRVHKAQKSKNEQKKITKEHVKSPRKEKKHTHDSSVTVICKLFFFLPLSASLYPLSKSLTWITSMNVGGKTSSTRPTSELNRFRIRPTGFVSKKRIGEWTTRENAWSWRLRDAWCEAWESVRGGWEGGGCVRWCVCVRKRVSTSLSNRFNEKHKLPWGRETSERGAA